MTNFTVPFTIDHPNKNDFILSKQYEEREEIYLLTIPKNREVTELLVIQMKPAADMDFSLMVNMEEGSSAVIVEDWSGVQSPSLHYKNHLKCGQASQLSYIILHLPQADAEITEERHSELQDKAVCHVYQYIFGGKKLTSSLLQKAVGHDAEMTSDVAIKASKDQEFSLRWEHQYAGKNGAGDMNMKGIAQDKAIVTFNGLINISQSGGGSGGFLDQEVLNLSSDTVVKAVPGLKIDTNDVKAGHRAAIRNLNEEDFYYFAARGIDSSKARQLLINGFLEKELKKVEQWPEIYEKIKKLI